MGTPTLAIIGAGFSGTTLAAELLRRARAPLRILLIDRAQTGRGLAYARRTYPYLLNVPAGRMSADGTDAGAFLRFARAHLPYAQASDFLPRELYGDYLESTLSAAEQCAPPEVTLERLHGTVIALERPVRAGPTRLHFGHGRILTADSVVLALGNAPPAELPGTQALRGSERYVADPWNSAHAPRAGETVLVLGSGLTMADVVLAGTAATAGRVQFHALSRHGWVPPAQNSSAGTPDPARATDLLQAAGCSARALFVAVRELASELESRGGDWREAVTFVRGLAPQLWERLPHGERRRFLRHLRPLWDVHRHRLPESTHEALGQLRREGSLQVHAGRLLALERRGTRVQVTYRARGATTPERLLVDRVVNCTGPDFDARRTRERLLRALLAQGTVTADPLGLGLVTGGHGAVVDASGRAASDLFYLGPLLRARHWETTAAAELRAHAAALATHLCGQLAHEAPRLAPRPRAIARLYA
jgi:uncharacterized NAD(P)/FAD-binding protein YdhS